jgi:hypothetical protein
MTDKFDLPLSIEGSIDQIPDSYRPFYQPDEQGNYQLADPLLRGRVEGVAKLTTVVQKERKRASELEKLAKDRAAMLSRLTETLGAVSEAELPLKVQELASLASPSATNSLKSEIEATFRSTYGAQIKQRDAENERLRMQLQSNIVDREATAAIAAAKGSPRLLTPHVRGAMKLVEEGGELHARVIDEDGEIRYRTDGQPMTAQDLVQELKRDPEFGMGFENSGNSGSGAISRGSGAGGGAVQVAKSYTKAEWRETLARERDPEKRGQMMKDFSKGKVKITD